MPAADPGAPTPSDTVSEAGAGFGGDHNVAALHEAIAAEVPTRDCIVAAGVRHSWAEVTDRTRRLAAVLAGAGIGRRRHPPAGRALPPWESPHDHVALYLHNGHEYLEGMLGAWKAGAASVNVNYRFVASELRYVLADSGARGVVFHAAFAPTLAAVLADVVAGLVEDDRRLTVLGGRRLTAGTRHGTDRRPVPTGHGRAGRDRRSASGRQGARATA